MCSWNATESRLSGVVIASAAGAPVLEASGDEVDIGEFRAGKGPEQVPDQQLPVADGHRVSDEPAQQHRVVRSAHVSVAPELGQLIADFAVDRGAVFGADLQAAQLGSIHAGVPVWWSRSHVPASRVQTDVRSDVAVPRCAV